MLQQQISPKCHCLINNIYFLFIIYVQIGQQEAIGITLGPRLVEGLSQHEPVLSPWQREREGNRAPDFPISFLLHFTGQSKSHGSA